ncbi:GntR family transcriptional regulator [Paracoccus onubensis]|uniref:GntR family transcriptional regulator n=1 Tax=Paracoccus onubensis TaxID=1675788 RepID=A0A418SN38_9RHOB|nr:GntR family transcriptional regulator [Paracoccus onubensis]RJE82370.1 GntR family transcriptional regulator [Paracoccus onubensis]
MASDGTTANEFPRIGMTTAEQVVADLRRRILLGELVPGQRLKIDEIATLCGVSHMPVRTALQDLEAEGILIVHSRRGAEIRTIDSHYITNVLEVRGAVEAMLAGKCAEMIQSEDAVTLRNLATTFEEKAKIATPQELLQANFKLHNFINCIPNNSEAIFTLNRGRLLIETLRVRAGYGGTRIDAIIAEHRQLVDAICAHDQVAARGISQSHCDSARDELLKLVGS